MAKHTYVGDPKLVVAEKMTITEYKDDFIKHNFGYDEDKYNNRDKEHIKDDDNSFYEDFYSMFQSDHPEFAGVTFPYNEKGYKVTHEKGISVFDESESIYGNWLPEHKFESKFFKINNASYLQKAKEFKVKLRNNKSISLKTSNGVERPSLLISNAVLTVISDWAKNGLLEDK